MENAVIKNVAKAFSLLSFTPIIIRTKEAALGVKWCRPASVRASLYNRQHKTITYIARQLLILLPLLCTVTDFEFDWR
jgi:hypothetical protein